MSAVPIKAAARNNMPKTKTYRAWLVGVVLAGVLLLLHSPTISLAQDQDQSQQQDQYQDQQQDQQDGQDPPSIAARMNYTQGSVTFQPGGEGDWVDRSPQPAANQRRQSLDR